MAQADSRIHPTALVDPRAELAADVAVGAYSVVGPHVTIGAATVIASHVVIEGRTTIGARNRIAAYNAIGGDPQDKKYAGEPTRLEIGDDNLIREFGTFNIGTVQGGGVTRIGDDNWIMAYVHVAHDCIVGSHTIFANKAQIAGHAEVGDWAILGGDTGVHQFVRIGDHAITGIGTMLRQDVPPFTMVSGDPAAPHGINVEGLKRRGFDPATIAALKAAYKALYRSGMTLDEARAAIDVQAGEPGPASDALRTLHGFLGTATRGIVR
ncbi:MAG: acyl-ACP--UDP-N-acetylglucosamine O-acyltransferase [Burkholderiaceae bacterium]